MNPGDPTQISYSLGYFTVLYLAHDLFLLLLPAVIPQMNTGDTVNSHVHSPVL